MVCIFDNKEVGQCTWFCTVDLKVGGSCGTIRKQGCIPSPLLPCAKPKSTIACLCAFFFQGKQIKSPEQTGERTKMRRGD